MNLLLLLSLVISAHCIEFAYRNCLEDGLVKLSNLRLEPHPVDYPGTVKLSVDVDVFKDISVDTLTVKVVAEKTSPRKMKFPCISGMGSCTYEYCDLWKNVYETIPDTKAVPECSARVGRHSYRNVEIPLTYSGVAFLFQSMIKGDYTTMVTLYDDETRQVYGCTQVNFTVNYNKKMQLLFENELA